MPQYEEYKHKGTIFQVRIPLEWDEFDDHIEFNGIKFSKMVNLIGFFEIFSRMDYEFGGLNNCIFIDVGANIGDSALYAASKQNIQKVYAYEPFSRPYNMAETNISMNPELSEKIELYNYGWFSRNIKDNLPEIDDINASAVNTVVPDFAQAIKRECSEESKIELKKSSDILKEVLAKHTDNPIILKMDIEGAEYECIKDIDISGLFNKIDIVFLEWHLKGHQQITDILEKNNFIWFNERLSAESGFIRAYRKQ
ncbi:MAG: FkbM family methyltransferase [Candidatus Gastranaerophilales bacterium]|nr:FkbM family methyltransferase [Candidatus Gastranaerophilales bacterium]